MKIKDLPEMEIAVQKINPSSYNPRKDLKPGDPEYERIKRSMETFGNAGGIVWNKKTGNLIGGHQRLKILLADGAKRVKVRVADVPVAKEKAMNIVLNKAMGEFDRRKLTGLLVELDESDLDIEETGFDADEIKELIAEADESGVIDGKVKFSEELGEANNYIVLVFKNDTDFLQAETLFELESVYSRRRNGKPWAKGVGRVLSGPEAIEKIKAAAR